MRLLILGIYEALHFGSDDGESGQGAEEQHVHNLNLNVVVCGKEWFVMIMISRFDDVVVFGYCLTARTWGPAMWRWKHKFDLPQIPLDPGLEAWSLESWSAICPHTRRRVLLRNSLSQNLRTEKDECEDFMLEMFLWTWQQEIPSSMKKDMTN